MSSSSDDTMGIRVVIASMQRELMPEPYALEYLTALTLGWLDMAVCPFRAEYRHFALLIEVRSDMPSVDA
jgi:hypothetical protein